jgi:DNA repair exonuclease SbcCD ATPase subunit
MSGITHYEGCWQDPRHHACALTEIERLRKSLDDHLESEAAETRRANRERDLKRQAEDRLERVRLEIERLRQQRNDLAESLGDPSILVSELQAEIESLHAHIAKIEGGPVLQSEWEQQQAEIERLREVIQQVRDLLDDGTLIRDTSHDHEITRFVEQGMRITKMVAGIQEVLGDETL